MPEAVKTRGIRGRIAERKKEELTDYMKNAVALVKSYVPPAPAKIQAAKDAGNVSVDIVEPKKRVRLNFNNYEKPGDTLGVNIDLISNLPVGLNVNSYLDNAADTVTSKVTMGKLNDGTVFASEIVLDAKEKNLAVTVTHSGYRKTAQ